MEESRQDRLIITAASDAFGLSLLALLGSLNLNWPEHPPVLVYDIGLDATTLKSLEEHRIPVRRVPAFCPHWREHFTWKIWCINDAPARDVLWMDAGLAVLRSAGEIFDALDERGYFLTSNNQLLDWEASEQACEGCGVSTEFRQGKLTLAGTLMAFRKTGKTLHVLEEALSVALTEKNIAATEVTHRHDQAIISLLAYKHLGRVLVADRTIYLGSLSPSQVPGQRVWVHRRRIRRVDAEHLAAHISTHGEPYIPSAPYPVARARALSKLYKVHWYYGAGDHTRARDALRMAFRIDPSLKRELPFLAMTLRRYQRKLRGFENGQASGDGFMRWALKHLVAINGVVFVWKLARCVKLREDRRKPGGYAVGRRTGA